MCVRRPSKPNRRREQCSPLCTWSPRGKAEASPRPVCRAASLTCLARPGDVVEIGQSLAEVASLEVEALQFDLAAAANELQFARQVLDGLKASADAVPGQDLLDAENRVRQAENALVVLRGKWQGLGLDTAAVEQLLASPDKPTVVALPVASPIKGTIVRADVAVGRVIEPAEPLFEVIDLARVRAAIGVLERDSHRVAAGQAVELRLSAFPGEVITGTIRGLDPTLQSGTGLVTAWAEFENPTNRPPKLLPGMTGEARVVLPAETGVRVVPAEAIVDNGVERSVLVEEASTAGELELRRRMVEVVRAAKDRAAIARRTYILAIGS